MSKGQLTGMRGVYLVAAELSRLGFVVSPTSRSARGADLLVTDQECRKAWTVQVKTNAKPANFWLLGKHDTELSSKSHVYVYVNLKDGSTPEYLVAPSSYVSGKIRISKATTGSVWYSFQRSDRPYEDEGWQVFGDPHVQPASEQDQE
jgi:hypothetical protein